VTSGELTEELIKNYLEHHFAIFGFFNAKLSVDGISARMRVAVH
jgi:hypothetical protein